MAEADGTFVLYRLETMEEVREQIRSCEGKHPQQVSYSTYHDALTQICFGCGAVRTSMGYGKRRERASERVMRELDEDGTLVG